MFYHAKHEFRKVTLRLATQIKPTDFKGPIIKLSERYQNEIVYKWYKQLPFKDTAWVNVYISRSRFKSPDIKMNEGINYLIRKPHNLYEVFPSCDKYSMRFNEESLDQLFKNSTFDALMKKEKLLTILKEGFYDVVKVDKKLTLIIFWEPLGIIHTENDKSETRYSVINLDDQCQVSLYPYLLSDSLENYLVLKEDGYHYIPERK